MFNLFGRITLDGKGFEAGLNRIDKAIGGLKGRIAAALGVGAISALITRSTAQLINYSKEITNLSRSFGLSAESLQEFDFIAKQSGSDLNNFIDIIRQLSRNREAALANPATQAAMAFEKLGVSIDDLKNKDLISLLTRIGDAFKNAKNPQEVMGLGVQALGESSSRIFPAMINGLDDLRDSARRLGLVMSNETVASFADLSLQLETLEKQLLVTFSDVALYGLERMNELLITIKASVSALSAGFANWSLQQIWRGITGDTNFNADIKMIGKAMDMAFKNSIATSVAEYTRAAMDRRARLGAPGFVGIPDRQSEPDQKQAANIFRQNLTEAQRVGAFISDRGMMRVADQQLNELRAIRRAVETPDRQARQESIY